MSPRLQRRQVLATRPLQVSRKCMPTRHFALSLPHFVLCARTVTPLAAESTMRAFVPLAGVGEPPAINALQHIATIFQKSPSKEAGKNMVSIGTGLPPVPQKLVERIQAGEYVDMVELLPDCLGIHGGSTAKEEKGSKRRRQITSIAEWVQCFGVFMAVVASMSPDRTIDLLGYQSIIVEASREYEGETWLGYDRRFRQMAAAKLGCKWATVDPTLWNMPFTGHAWVQRCKYCFSLSHQATECEWAPSAKPTGTSPSNSRARSSNPVCKSWNFSNQASCDFRNCNYLHACLLCTKDPTVTDKGHKIINCPKRQSTRQPARIPQYSPPQMAQPQPQPLHQAQQAQQPQQLFQPAPQPQQYQRFKPY